MTIQEIESAITTLADSHQREQDDEFAYLYEIEAHELILQYLLDNNISLGNYDLKGLGENDEQYEEDRADIMAEIQWDVLSENPPFEVHPDALHLYTFHKKAFWPDTDEE